MNPHSGIIIDIKLSGFFAEFCPASVFSETRLSFLALKRPPAGWGGEAPKQIRHKNIRQSIRHQSI